MSFDDLPDGWHERPLNDPVLRGDVVDLCMRASDRVRRSLLLLVCDDEHRGIQPFVINDIPHGPAYDERSGLFTILEGLPIGALVVALGLPSAFLAEKEIQGWARSMRLMCDRLGVELLGFHVATLSDVWEVEPAA